MYKTTFTELKTRAKDVLKSNYWYSFGVCILISLITSLGTSVATVTNMVNSDAGSAGTSISAVLQILIALFVTFPLSVGSCRFFIKATVNAPNVYDLFFPYKNNLGNVIGINVFVAIYTFLWSLLFIIPGIIKLEAHSGDDTDTQARGKGGEHRTQMLFAGAEHAPHILFVRPGEYLVGERADGTPQFLRHTG